MNWKVERGEFEVLVGSSSEDIRQTGHFSIRESRIVDGRMRGMYAAVAVE